MEKIRKNLEKFEKIWKNFKFGHERRRKFDAERKSGGEFSARNRDRYRRLFSKCWAAIGNSMSNRSRESTTGKKIEKLFSKPIKKLKK